MWSRPGRISGVFVPRVTKKNAGVVYTCMSGYANGHGWTTQLYGQNTVWIPWTGSGQNVGLALPKVGQTVTDGVHTGVITQVQDNPGAYSTKILRFASNIPFGNVATVTII